jgi:hypothetical protein
MSISESMSFSQQTGKVVEIKVNFNENIVYVDNTPYNLVQIKKVLGGSTPISNNLPKGGACLHGPFFVAKDEEIVINLFSNPPNTVIIVGVVNSKGEGKGIIDDNYDGAASFIYDCQMWDEYFGVVIALDKEFYYQGFILHQREYW